MAETSQTLIDEVRGTLTNKISLQIRAFRDGDISLEELLGDLTAFIELYRYVDEDAADRFSVNMWDLTALSELTDDASPQTRRAYEKRIVRALSTLDELLALIKN